MIHISNISLALLALVAGVALFIYIKNQTKIKDMWPIVAAWIVIILSSLSILCSVFHTLRFWNYDYYRMHKKMMKHQNMMDSYRDKKNSDNTQEMKNIKESSNPEMTKIK
jgi:hypothetical protein